MLAVSAVVLLLILMSCVEKSLCLILLVCKTIKTTNRSNILWQTDGSTLSAVIYTYRHVLQVLECAYRRKMPKNCSCTGAKFVTLNLMEVFIQYDICLSEI